MWLALKKEVATVPQCESRTLLLYDDHDQLNGDLDQLNGDLDQLNGDLDQLDGELDQHSHCLEGNIEDIPETD